MMSRDLRLFTGSASKCAEARGLRRLDWMGSFFVGHSM
jgi:hypothetical protein